ncbi:MAG TPA: dockerin type I domain-containing protein, partial [Pirellulales bacterium]
TGSKIQPGQAYQSSGLENSASWYLTWTSPTHMIAGYSDIRAAESDDGGGSWSFNYTGDSQNAMYRSIVVTRGGQQFVYAATASVHDMYQSTYLTDSRIDGGTGQVLFSTDGGTTWKLMHNFGHVVMWVEADPNNPNRLYASVANSDSTMGGIYVTNDAQDGAASTWTKLANPPRTQGHAFNIKVLNDGTLVATYSGRRDSSGAFTASSGVFVSTNGGSSWQDVSAPGMLYWTKDITIDPTDPTQNTWYVSVFSGFGGPPNGLGGLYRTTDRGATWTKINSLDRVNSIAVNPTNGNEAYLTTEIDGLWYTSNLKSANPTFTQVDGYHFMQPMRVFYNPYNANEVWVTSFGGGLQVGEATPAIVPGDFNRDGAVTPADVSAMMTALADLNSYRTAKGLSATDLTTLGDLNGDGAVNNRDLQGLISLAATKACGGSGGGLAAASSGETAIADADLSIASAVEPQAVINASSIIIAKSNLVRAATDQALWPQSTQHVDRFFAGLVGDLKLRILRHSPTVDSLSLLNEATPAAKPAEWSLTR